MRLHHSEIHKCRDEIEVATENRQRMAAFYKCIMELAHGLKPADAVEICHHLRVPESYAIEVRKLLNYDQYVNSTVYAMKEVRDL